jgi:hypothetical protein
LGFFGGSYSANDTDADFRTGAYGFENGATPEHGHRLLNKYEKKRQMLMRPVTQLSKPG